MMRIFGSSIRMALTALMLLLTTQSAFAVLPDEKLANPVLEARALALSKELRCVVCQNQSIDDSAAPIARDMRLLLRGRIVAGDSDKQAVDYLVARYGNYVLLKPPFQSDTWILWLGPFAVLVLAGTGLFFSLRNKAALVPATPLSASERQRVARLLAERGRHNPSGSTS